MSIDQSGLIDTSTPCDEPALVKCAGHKSAPSEPAEVICFKPQQCANEPVSIEAASHNDSPGVVNRLRALEQKLARVTSALEQSLIREQQLLHHAFHDNLTGLPNAELFQDRLVNAMVQAERHRWQMAVMFIDLDGFKNINDTHGHDIGDCLLKIVAQRLQKLVRRGDTVCRRSGDEFLFLMPEAKSKETVVTLAGKITGKIADPCRIGELEVTTTASVGVAVFPEDGRLPNELLKNADTAMYAAKRRRISFTFYRELVNP
jgi:diguanylate cyclase